MFERSVPLRLVVPGMTRRASLLECPCETPWTLERGAGTHTTFYGGCSRSRIVATPYLCERSCWLLEGGPETHPSWVASPGWALADDRTSS